MALKDTSWYIQDNAPTSTVGWSAVSAWQANHSYSAGTFIRQLATPTVGNERCFVCIVAGTSAPVTEPVWVVTRGANTGANIDNTVTWQECTGIPGPCGDLTNSNVWTDYKNTAVTLGAVIYDVTSASLQICSTAGTAGNGASPSFSATAGVVTSDGATLKWTSLGPTSNYTAAFKYPHARYANALASTWAAAGNQFGIADNHAETQSTAITLLTPGTLALPCNIFCISHTTTLANATLATTASIATTGVSNINISGSAFYKYGLNFSAGDGSNTASILGTNSINSETYESCVFKVNNTSATSTIALGINGGSVGILTTKNCSYVLGATGQSLLNSNSSYSGTSIGDTFFATGSVPTTAFKPSSAHMFSWLYRDCDFSSVTATLFAGTENDGDVYIENCKLGAGVAMPNITVGTGPKYHFHNCDSAATNYRYYYGYYPGAVQQETTIVRTGSLVTDGVTAISWNLTSTANSKFMQPFLSEEIGQWNSLTGASITATFYLISGTTLNNNDFWAEVEYLGNASFPIGSVATNKMTLLGSPGSLTSDTSTWGGSTNKYKIALSFTPQMKGFIKARFYLAKATSTVYVDPFIYITDSIGNQIASGRSAFIPGFGYVNETAKSFNSSMVDING